MLDEEDLNSNQEVSFTQFLSERARKGEKSRTSGDQNMKRNPLQDKTRERNRHGKKKRHGKNKTQPAVNKLSVNRMNVVLPFCREDV